MSLRLRVALFTALASTVVMVAIGAALLASFRADQAASLIAVLEQQFDVLAEPAITAARLDRPRIDNLIEERLLAPAVVRVWSGGELLLAVGAEDTDLGLPRAGELTTVDDYRVLTRAVEARLQGVRPLTVQVAVSTAESDDIFAALRRRALRITAFGVALFALGGWLAATGALSPLFRLRRVTEGVAESADLSRRVDANRSEPAEIRDMADSFDVMMSRLEEADHRRQQALESARSFGAAAAHELRTPLTSIGANLEVLAADPDHEEREKVLEDLLADHRRMREMLDGLRLLARGDHAGREVFEELDLADIAGQSVADARRRHPGDEIGLDIDAQGVSMRGWPEGLRLMLDNLIGNALVHGRSDDGVARVSVRLIRDDELVTVQVDDEGPGIPVEERDIVTGRFQRGRVGEGADGSGLGLALVDQQARLHGGRVEVGSSSSGGARMTVRLSPVS